MENKKTHLFQMKTIEFQKFFQNEKHMDGKYMELFHKALCYQRAIFHLIGYFIVTFKEISFQIKKIWAQETIQKQEKKKKRRAFLKYHRHHQMCTRTITMVISISFFVHIHLNSFVLHRIICQIIICFLKHWENEIAPRKKKHNNLKEQTNFCFVIS